MLHRIIAMLIVGFWLAMTGLLVIRELYPGLADLNSVPAGHVGRQLFRHGQVSELQIYDGAKHMGYLRIEPGMGEDRRSRQIKTLGSMTLNLPGMAKRLSWGGSIGMDADFNLTVLDMTFSIGEPVQQIDIHYEAAANLIRYALRTNGREYARSEFTMDADGMRQLLAEFGFGPEFLAQFQTRRAQTPPPEFSAVNSDVTLNGESVPTFLLTMKIGGQTLWEAHLSQLGQVVKARAPIFGYKLLPDGVKP